MGSLVVPQQQHPIEMEAVATFPFLSYAINAVQSFVTSFVEASTKLQSIYGWRHLRMVWRRFLLTSTLMVISLELFQQFKMDTEILVPVSVGDT